MAERPYPAAETGNEDQSPMLLSVINSLCQEFSEIYQVDCETQQVRICRFSGRVPGVREAINSGLTYRDAMDVYIRTSVLKEDRPLLEFALNFKNVLDRLAVTPMFIVHYRIFRNNEIHYYYMKCVLATASDNSRGVVMGFANEDSIHGCVDHQGGVKTGRLNRRSVLVVDDDGISREILCTILENEYDVLQAADGEEGLRVLREHYRELSAVLLDVVMPVCDGYEFLRRSQPEPMLAAVPVIVTTAGTDVESEVRCMELGASDFVHKPYHRKLVLARLHSIIKLHESVASLSAIEYDDVTGLYTRQAFYHHAQELMESVEDDGMAVMAMGVTNLPTINLIYGQKSGNQVLSYLSGRMTEVFPDLIGYRSGNVLYFLLKKEQINRSHVNWEKMGMEMTANSPVSNTVLRYGLDFHVRKDTPVSHLCERASIALDSLNGGYGRNYAIYNEKMT